MSEQPIQLRRSEPTHEVILFDGTIAADFLWPHERVRCQPKHFGPGRIVIEREEKSDVQVKPGEYLLRSKDTGALSVIPAARLMERYEQMDGSAPA